MSAEFGDTIFYNEGSSLADSWAIGQCTQTATSNPNAQAVFGDDNYSYTPTPDTGNINVGYWSNTGGTSLTQNGAYNVSEGTDPGQYSTTLPANIDG